MNKIKIIEIAVQTRKMVRIDAGDGPDGLAEEAWLRGSEILDDYDGLLEVRTKLGGFFVVEHVRTHQIKRIEFVDPIFWRPTQIESHWPKRSA